MQAIDITGRTEGDTENMSGLIDGVSEVMIMRRSSDFYIEGFGTKKEAAMQLLREHVNHASSYGENIESITAEFKQIHDEISALWAQFATEHKQENCDHSIVDVEGGKRCVKCDLEFGEEE